MKKYFLWSLLPLLMLFAYVHPAQAQQAIIECVVSSNTPCNSSVNPGNGVQGDPAWKFNGKSNANFTQLFNMYSIIGIPYFNGGPPNIPTLATAAQIAAAFPGTAGTGWCLGTNGVTQACGGGGGGGTPGGTSGQLQYNNGGTFGGFTMAGDCALNATTGVITCIKSNGVSFASSAFTDTTNAANISFGTLAAARLPAALPGVTSVNNSTIPASAGALGGTSGTFVVGDCVKVASLSPTIFSDFGANCGGSGGTGTPGGANNSLQYNNSGIFGGFILSGDCTVVVSTGVITCPRTNGSTFSASATTDTTNASNITAGLLNASRIPSALPGTTSINGTLIAASAGTAPGSTGTFVIGDCVKVGSISPLEIQDQGATCGGGGSGGTPAGSNLQIQYNNAGSFGAYGAAAAIEYLNSPATNTITAGTYTFVSGDRNIPVALGGTVTQTATVPPNSSVAFAVGDLLSVQQTSTGFGSVCPGSGVTFVSAWYGSSTSQCYALGSTNANVQFQKIATDTWYVPSWVSVLAEAQTYGTKFATTGSTCTVTSSTGTATMGTVTLGSAGGCTLVITPGFSAKVRWRGNMGDETQTTIPEWGPASSTATAVTFNVPGAAVSGDTVSFGPLGAQ